MRVVIARVALAFVVIVSAAGLGAGGPACGAPGPDPGSVTRVLFVGNSFTYFNDLPAIVEALAEASGRTLSCKAVVSGGFSLEDHWLDGRARRAIAEGGWDVVVLQQGPSSSPEGRESLLLYSRRFTELIRSRGAQPALYMVWPSESRLSDLEGVIESYRQTARDVRGLLLPAGDAWRRAWKRDKTLALYGPDGLHPTAAGSYLAALVMVAQLCGRSPIGLPATLTLRSGTKIEIPGEQARVMQEAAAEAVEKCECPSGGAVRRATAS